MAGTQSKPVTLQSNIKSPDYKYLRDYSLFLGGTNATHQALRQYDPLRSGYNRIFFLKMPVFLDKLMPDKTKNFKHLLEYGFTKIDGIGNTTLETDQVTGGYAGRGFDVGTVAKDETNNITISLYEFAGSPVREYLDMWITGISDPYTGLGHYHGALDLKNENIRYAQYNHVAEAVYVATDPTGRSEGVEYACLLTNMMPKTVKKDQFNYESGQHNIVQVDVDFTAIKYESPQINTLAKALITRFQTMKDYLGFETEYGVINGERGHETEFANSLEKNYIVNWPSEANAGATKR